MVGELLTTLEQLGVANNTIVIFTSDNGPETTSVIHLRADYGHDGARPWRGVKRDSWEGGHRVPFLVRWPGKDWRINNGSDSRGSLRDPTLVRGANHDNNSYAGPKVKAGTTSAQLTSLTDVMATVAAIIGVKLPDNAAEDSFNLLPAWLREDHAAIRPYLLQQAFAGQRTLSIRRGDWKYLDHTGSGGNRYENNPGLKPFHLPDTAPDAPGQLYNLETDPGETKNLSFEHPEIVTELKALLEQSKATGRSNKLPTTK